MPKAFVAVINDLVTDQRVHRTCLALQKAGYEVLLYGRRKRKSPAVESRDYQTKRIKLLFEKGMCFYACFNIRLFCHLIFHKYDLVVSNDLDTLPACYYAGKIRKSRLIYDSHEYFTGVPELTGRTKTIRVWKFFEKRILPGLKHTMTVNSSVARLYCDEYSIGMKVVMNVPLPKDMNEDERILEKYKLSNRSRYIIYQGALNKDRGLEELIGSMAYVPEDLILLLAGDGDLTESLKKLAIDSGLEHKVRFLGRIPLGELHQVTMKALVGISAEKDTNLNYHNSLPNKIFDYIQAGVPVLASPFPEISHIFGRFEIGMLLKSHDMKEMGSLITEMIENAAKREFWRVQLAEAAREYSWKNEEQKLLELIG
ncbi:MAG: glycosyltransferase [Bacteroidetes bacterium]|nr:glycosyltransferase [Bacteroidota bacterium]